MLNIRPIFPQSRQQLRRFNFRLVARLLGVLLLIQAATMVVAIAVSVYFGDGSQYGLILSGLVIFMLGVFLRNFVGANCSNELHEKESFWITTIIWIVVPLMGALPYLFTSSVSSFTDAAFESFSGFTTTGSSVLVRLDSLPQGLLVWRSSSQWVGGWASSSSWWLCCAASTRVARVSMRRSSRVPSNAASIRT